MKITVLGAGSWGTTLAILLSENQHDVTLWAHRPEFAKQLQEERENKRYLKCIAFPENLRVLGDILEAVVRSEIVVVATPSQAVRETLTQLNGLDHAQRIFVIVSKGIEVKTGMRMSEVVRDSLPSVHLEQVAILYGPSHAEELSRKQPTTVVVASHDLKTSRKIQEVFTAPMFRVYVNTDVVGVELAGSVKNIMAIAAGIADGVGFGDNAKAAIITRGLAEMSRLGAQYGANPLTFSGLAGIGDLVVTCASRHSRNRYVGEQIGKGRKLQEIIDEMVMIAEGVSTTKAVMDLAKKADVEMPLTEAVYKMLYEGKDARTAVYELMTREPKHELM
ncbi:MAG: NAD(P)H-dependent glycerol-3-phosphate dehydrogenase [Chloroherpetonaceae bacterium]|nr:NAD(P)H-dependent glycerol-3-phosphate dehydrogenase [Chloroherpetonaceae bacterium]